MYCDMIKLRLGFGACHNVCIFMQVYQDTPGVEHIPVVQIDLSVPLKVPGKPACERACLIFKRFSNAF